VASLPAGNARLRILIVSAYAMPHLGGVEVVVEQQARTLASLGHQVTVLTSRCGGGQARERRDGYEVIRVAAWNGLERRGSVPVPLWTPLAIVQIARLVRRADIVHVHDAYHASSFFAALFSRWNSRPLFLTAHVGIVSHDSRAVEAVQRLFYATVAPVVWRRACSVTAYNPIVSQFLIGHGVPPGRVRLTCNGVDTAEFCPGTPDEVAATRARFGLSPDRPLVLFVGRLVPKKGADKLLLATSPRYQLVLAGPGRIPGPPGADVAFLGPVSRPELLAIYQASDIFACPATGEMFTLAMQEAMSCGLPVVATDEPGYASYDLDPRGLALVRPEPDALRATFLDILGDPPRRRHMQRYSRMLAEQKFDWHKNTASLAADYEMAAGARRTRGKATAS
jgi:D-inositol-3-phosphate glycosyltransferase